MYQRSVSLSFYSSLLSFNEEFISFNEEFISFSCCYYDDYDYWFSVLVSVSFYSSFTLVSIKLINLSCNQQTYLLLLKSLQSISHLFNFLLNCISKCCGIFTLRLFLILIFFLNNIFLCLINNLLHLFDIFLI